MSKKFLIYLAVVAAIAVGVYAYVGGFAQVTVTQTVTQQTFMAGKYFEGNPDSETLGNIYLEVGKALEEKKLSGDLGGIFYSAPTENNKIVKAFVGVVVADSSATLPAGFELRTVAAGAPVLQGSLDASMMIAPKKIYSALFDHAEDNNLILEEFYLERFPEGQPAVIQIKLQGK